MIITEIQRVNGRKKGFKKQLLIGLKLKHEKRYTRDTELQYFDISGFIALNSLINRIGERIEREGEKWGLY